MAKSYETENVQDADEGAGDCRDEKCQEQSMPMLTAEEVNLSSMENKVNNRKRKLVIYGCAGGALSIIVLVATIVITILVVRHYDAASIGGSGGSCASAAECKKGLWCVNSKCAKSDIALSDDKADGICERGCSDVKEQNRKFVLRGKSDNLVHFEGLQFEDGKCPLVCFELDYVQLFAETLKSSLQNCTELVNICTTNLKIVGKFGKKIVLPNLRQFKQSRVDVTLFDAPQIFDVIFFNNGAPWILDGVTGLKTHIEVSSADPAWAPYPALYVHRKQKKIFLSFKDCDGVLLQRDESFDLQDLRIHNCNFRASESFIPNTLRTLALDAFSIQGGSLAQLVYKQSQLEILRAGAAKLHSSYAPDFPLELKHLPSTLKKIQYSGRVILQATDVSEMVPLPNLQELIVDELDTKVLNNFVVVFPRLRLIGLGDSVPILAQAVKIQSLRTIVAYGGNWHWYTRTAAGGSDQLDSILRSAGFIKGVPSNFILQRETLNDTWTVKTENLNEINKVLLKL